MPVASACTTLSHRYYSVISHNSMGDIWGMIIHDRMKRLGFSLLLWYMQPFWHRWQVWRLKNWSTMYSEYIISHMSNYPEVQWQVLVEMVEQQLLQQASLTEMMVVTSQLVTLYTGRLTTSERHSNITTHNLFISSSYNKHCITITPFSSQSPALYYTQHVNK